MNVVGPCLSPVSMALQQFHKHKKQRPPPANYEAGFVNPMLVRKMVYSPPIARKAKRKRAQFEQQLADNMIVDEVQVQTIEDEHLEVINTQTQQLSLNSTDSEQRPQKIRKLLHVQPSNKDMTIGKSIKLRFGVSEQNDKMYSDFDICLSACVIVSESFGVLVMVKEDHPKLPNVRKMGRFWASWKGTLVDNVPLLDVIHAAD